MRLIFTAPLILGVVFLSGCVKREPPVVNHVQDVTEGDTAEVRVIGFTAESMMWGDFDCKQNYKMPAKGYYPHLRQTFESKPAFIDKGFKKSNLPKNKYPLDMTEYHVRAGKLLSFWASNSLSDGRYCTETITIRPEKDKLYEFRNSHSQNMCFFEIYEVNKSTGDATRMRPTQYTDMCKV